jgi:hypothetical protein
MGYVHGRTGSYGSGLALLAVVSAATLLLTLTVVRTGARRRAAGSVSAGEPAPRAPEARTS